MEYKDADHKLKHARKLFEDCIEHAEEAHAEALRASRFYHNTNLEGQWEEGDLQYLRDNQRMVLSFNIIKPKVKTFLGIYADAQRTPRVVDSGAGDGLLAQCLDFIKSQLLQDAYYEETSGRQLKIGTIQGECGIQIEFKESPEGKDWVELALHLTYANEVHWDYDSVLPDRRDAKYLFIHRWLSKEEFVYQYPKYAKEWNLMSSQSDVDFEGILERDFSEENSDDTGYNYSDYDRSQNERFYFDRKKNKVRVIRYEYKTRVKVQYIVDQETGERKKIDKSLKKRVELAAARGIPVEVEEQTEEKTMAFDFIGCTILEEYDEAGPFNGFSIVPFSYEVDDATGNAYGYVHDMFDPQMEINKSASLLIEHIAQSTAPGTTAEEDAIPNTKQYEDEKRRPNGIAFVAKNALQNGAVIDRPAPPINEAVVKRAADSAAIFHEISGIPSSVNVSAAEHAQPGVSLAIRYHKSRQGVSDPFAHYEAAQKQLVQKVLEGIVSTVPDDQLMEILGRNGDITIQDGLLVEMGDGPPDQTGRPTQVPKRQSSLRDLRTLKWKLDMSYTSENSTLRMLELDILSTLAGNGIPVDPEVLVEDATNDESKRRRLKKYVEQAKIAQAEGAKAEREDMQRQTAGIIQSEFAKIQETMRHNMVVEQTTITDNEIQAKLKQLEIYEKADAAEKDRIMEIARAVMDSKKEKKETGGTDGQATA